MPIVTQRTSLWCTRPVMMPASRPLTISSPHRCTGISAQSTRRQLHGEEDVATRKNSVSVHHRQFRHRGQRPDRDSRTYLRFRLGHRTGGSRDDRMAWLDSTTRASGCWPRGMKGSTSCGIPRCVACARGNRTRPSTTSRTRRSRKTVEPLSEDRNFSPADAAGKRNEAASASNRCSNPAEALFVSICGRLCRLPTQRRRALGRALAQAR